MSLIDAQIKKQSILTEFFRTRSYPKKNIIDNILSDQPFSYNNKWEELFLEAMRWSLRHHINHSEFYQKLCSSRGFKPDNLRSFEDIWDIPYVLTDIFKFYSIDTKTDDSIKVEFTSSGTSGRKSRVVLDTISGQRLLYSTFEIYQSLGLVDFESSFNYLIATYNPLVAEEVATSNSDLIVSHFTSQKNIFYALDKKQNSEEIQFLLEEAVEKLLSFVNEGVPIRILGFPHHIVEILETYYSRYGKVEFPPKSYILTGGGWKSFSRSSKEKFNQWKFLESITNIPLENVRDVYSLVEHGITYLECEKHNKHIPNIALACARDPRSLLRLPSGEVGLIHLYTPIIESYPSLSILTTDYGVISESCPCAIGGPYLTITGRATLSRQATCALIAEQYIRSPSLTF